MPLAQLGARTPKTEALSLETELLDFVNNDLFKTLKRRPLSSTRTPLCAKVVVQAAFADANNYMKDGVLLRQVVNAIDEPVDFS